VSERVVSIKMPGSLVSELKRHTQEHHYIDLSEQIRSIVRQKCLKYSQPYDDIQKLRKDLEQQISTSNANRKEQILQELQRLLEGSK
jgi:Arc/MetJ-type ribon-helix-helix transcriptional regulator